MSIWKFITRKANVEQPLIVPQPTPQELRHNFIALSNEYALALSQLAMVAEVNGYKWSTEFYSTRARHIGQSLHHDYFVDGDVRKTPKAEKHY